MIPECQADVLKIVEKHPPASILAIGPDATAVFTAYLKAHPKRQFNAIPGPDIGERRDALGTHDLALISGTLEHTDKTEAGALIARVRDLHAHRLLLVAPAERCPQGTNNPWREGDFIAYGMHRIGAYGAHGNRCALYEFDIDNYKTTPDWLNSKYWGHPELWDKHRW